MTAEDIVILAEEPVQEESLLIEREGNVRVLEQLKSTDVIKEAQNIAEEPVQEEPLLIGREGNVRVLEQLKSTEVIEEAQNIAEQEEPLLTGREGDVRVLEQSTDVIEEAQKADGGIVEPPAKSDMVVKKETIAVDSEKYEGPPGPLVPGPSTVPADRDQRKRMILRQVEFYLGVNLAKDEFLFRQYDADPDHWIPVDLICSFKRMGRWTDRDEIVEALRESPSLLEVNDDGTKVRRKTQLTWIPGVFERSVYVKGFPEETESLQDELDDFFTRFGEVNEVRFRRTEEKVFKRSAFIEFKKEDGAKNLLCQKDLEFNGHKLNVMSKEDYCNMKMKEKGISKEDRYSNDPNSKRPFNAFREIRRREVEGKKGAFPKGGKGKKRRRLQSKQAPAGDVQSEQAAKAEGEAMDVSREEAPNSDADKDVATARSDNDVEVESATGQLEKYKGQPGPFIPGPATVPADRDQRKKMILRQVEFYLGVNLSKDEFLFRQYEGNPEHWILVETICGFKRMRRWTDREEVVEALRESPCLLEVSDDGSKVRRKTPLVWIPGNVERSVYAKGFPEETESLQDELDDFFAQFGEVNEVRFRRTEGNVFKRSVFVELSKEEDAKNLLGQKDLEFKGNKLIVMSKEDYCNTKMKEKGISKEDRYSSNAKSKRPFSAFREMRRRELGANKGAPSKGGRGKKRRRLQ